MFMARYTVSWEKPDVSLAVSDYFGNPDATAVFSKNGLSFSDDRELNRFLAQGKLSPIPDDVLAKVENFYSSSKDLDEKLRDQTYSQAYLALERKIEHGDLLLEAPIVILFKDGSYWGFSGKRRAYVARKHGIPVLYFIVKQESELSKKKEKKEKKLDEEYEKSENAEDLFSE